MLAEAAEHARMAHGLQRARRGRRWPRRPWPVSLTRKGYARAAEGEPQRMGRAKQGSRNVALWRAAEARRTGWRWRALALQICKANM